MKKETVTPQFDAQNFLDQEGVLHWITKYGSYVFYGAIALFLLMFFVYRMSSEQSSHAEANFVTAANLYQQAVSGKDAVKKTEAINDLLPILAKQPELKAVYQGDLAQILLERGAIDQALPLANETIARVSSDQIDQYLSYASASLLIEQKKYQEALKEAQQLKEQIKDNDLLNAFNLVRIALLQQELGDREGELQAWEQWKRYAGWKGTAPKEKTLDQKTYFVVQNYYGDGGLSLVNYIESRTQNK